MTADQGDDEPTEELSTMEETLLSSGIVEETPGGEDLRLTDEFEQRWHQRNRQMRGSDRAIRWFAASRDVDPDRIDVTTDGELYVLEIDGSELGTWPSEASFVAETVVRPTLRDWIPDEKWNQLEEDMLRELSARLLLFLERCPLCDEDVVLADEVDDGSVHLSLTCPACDVTLFSGTYQ